MWEFAKFPLQDEHRQIKEKNKKVLKFTSGRAAFILLTPCHHRSLMVLTLRLALLLLLLLLGGSLLLGLLSSSVSISLLVQQQLLSVGGSKKGIDNDSHFI